MNDKELLRELERMEFVTGSLATCLGCGHEHSCRVHGCAVIRAARDRIVNSKPKKGLPWWVHTKGRSEFGADVKYSVEPFPPLGAVEVVAEPVPSLGTAKPKTELPNILPAEGVSRPEPKPPAPPPERPPAEKPRPAETVSLRLPAQPKVVPKPVRGTEPVFVGQGATEKRRIHERLTRYWQTAEPGAMQRLAEQIRWPVANVYGAQRAERFDMDHWRQLDRGMDALGFELEGEK